MNQNSMRAFARDIVAMKRYILVSAILFAAGIVVGSGSPSLQHYLQSQIEPLIGTVERLEAMENTQLWMFLFIFFNNFIKAVAIVFLGALLSVIPIYFLVMNGMVLGFVVAMASQSGANAGALVITGILPHGILELTAIIIAGAYGMKYGVLIFRELASALKGRASIHELRAFHGTLKRLMSFLFFAMLAAAFIESTVTYFLVRG